MGDELDLNSLADADIDFSLEGSGGGGLETPVVATPSSSEPPAVPAATPPGGEVAPGTTAPTTEIPAGGAPAAPAAADPALPGGAAPATPAQQAWFEELNHRYGANFGQDDATARQTVSQLIGRARQMAQEHAEQQQWADLGRQLWEERQRAQQQPQAPQPQQPAQPQQPWSTVELSPQARMFVDPVTRTLRDGAPQHVQQEYIQWAVAQRQFQEQLWQKPGEVLAPVVQQTVNPLAQRIEQLEAQLAAIPRQQEAQRFAQANAQWMMQPDPLTGSYTYTPAGQRFMQYARQAQEQGVVDPRQIQDYGMNMLQRDLASAGMRQLEQQLLAAGIQPMTRVGQQPMQPQYQVQQPMVAPAAPLNPLAQHQANRAATLAAGAARVPGAGGMVNPGAPPRTNRVQDFAEQLMQANGITDDMIDFTR